MTASVGPTLPGLAPVNGHVDKPAHGKGKDSGFGETLNGAAKTPKTDKQHTADAAHQSPRWTKFPAGPDQRNEASAGEPVKPELPQLPVARTRVDDTHGKRDARQDDETDEDGDPKAEAQSDDNTAQLQGKLPLIMALHDLRRYSASPAAAGHPALSADHPAPSGKQSDGPEELDGVLAQPTPVSRPGPREIASPEKHAIAKAMPEQAQQRQQKETAQPSGPAFPTEKFPDNLLPGQPTGEAKADIAELPPKQPSPKTAAAEMMPPIAKPESVKQAATAGRVDIVTEQSFPAPAALSMNQTTATLVSVIASDNALRQAASTSPTQLNAAPAVAVATHVLKIELHPAELGMVTANLRLSGEQLSIELKPETQEAHRRLSADSDAIVKSLRGLGFDVDKVTVLQPSVATHASARLDSGGSMTGSAGRDQSSFQPGNSNGNGGAGGGQQSGRNRNDDGSEFGRGAPLPRDRADSDLFI